MIINNADNNKKVNLNNSVYFNQNGNAIWQISYCKCRKNTKILTLP